MKYFWLRASLSYSVSEGVSSLTKRAAYGDCDCLIEDPGHSDRPNIKTDYCKNIELACHPHGEELVNTGKSSHVDLYVEQSHSSLVWNI